MSGESYIYWKMDVRVQCMVVCPWHSCTIDSSKRESVFPTDRSSHQGGKTKGVDHAKKKKEHGTSTYGVPPRRQIETPEFSGTRRGF
jgi:hypothetical protein